MLVDAVPEQLWLLKLLQTPTLEARATVLQVFSTIHASEPQWSVWGFCSSLSELSELRRALICRSQASHLKYRDRRAVESKTRKIPSTLQACSFFSNPFY